MAEQRQPFRFRLPWLPPAPEPAPAVPRPSQAPSQPPPTQWRPFLPSRVGPTQPPPPAQPPTRAVPQPSSQFQATSQPTVQSLGQQSTPTRAAPQTQVTSSAQQVSPQPQPSQPARPIFSAPPKTPSEAALKEPPEEKPQSSQKKLPITMEVSRPQRQPVKKETLQPPSQESKKQPDIQDRVPKAASELAIAVSDPKPQVYKTVSEERTRMFGGMYHDEPKEKKVTDNQVSPLKAEPDGQLDEQRQYPSEVFERKKVLETFRAGARHTESDINGHGKAGRLPHKTATTGEKPALHKEMKEGLSRFVHKLGAGKDKYTLHEKPLSMITLTGENTGAIMHLSSESAKRESVHINRAYKIKQDEKGEGSSEGKRSGDSKIQEELAPKLHVNNNAQGINNSLVFNSSVTERNPGAHVVLSHNLEEAIKPSKERERVQTRKAEVASTVAERLAYAPSIKRRCLRGLFLESSDSEPENPQKPQRHGCGVGCDQKSKDESDDSVDVL